MVAGAAALRYRAGMCNEYELQRSQAEIRSLFGVRADRAGNLRPAHPFPDSLAPVVRQGTEGRELVNMRWGFPPPPGQTARPVTNARNVASPYWRPWLKREFRCLVPWDAFCEWTDSAPKARRWFALGEDRPLAAFAGVWRPWTGTRGTKAAPIEGDHLLFSFLTTEANAVVRPVHAKAMPVILTDPDEMDLWLTAPADDALTVQRPLADDRLVMLSAGLLQPALI